MLNQNEIYNDVLKKKVKMIQNKCYQFFDLL
jgi:hypothetical protein